MPSLPVVDADSRCCWKGSVPVNGVGNLSASPRTILPGIFVPSDPREAPETDVPKLLVWLSASSRRIDSLAEESVVTSELAEGRYATVEGKPALAGSIIPSISSRFISKWKGDSLISCKGETAPSCT